MPPRGSTTGIRSQAPMEWRDGLVTERFGDCVVVTSAGEEDEELRAFARECVADPSTLTVLVGSRVPGLPATMTALRAALGGLKGSGYRRIRLVVSDAGQQPAGPAGPVQKLADAVDLDVVAPIGKVLRVPGGTLFPITSSGAGRWRWFRPANDSAGTVGPWDFSAGWGAALTRVRLGARLGVSVHAIPAGLALLPERVTEVDAGDVLNCLPVDPEHPLVVVGDPGRIDGSSVDPIRIASFLGTLPPGLSETVRLAVAGLSAEPDLFSWGQRIADLSAATIRICTGVPLRVGDETRVFVRAGDDGGRVGWEPYALELTARPAEPGSPEPVPVIEKWRPPRAGRGEISPRIYQLDPDLVLEVLLGGLWLRRLGPVTTAQAQSVALDPLEPQLLVGVSGEAWPPSQEHWIAALTVDIRLDTGTTPRVRRLHDGQASPPGGQAPPPVLRSSPGPVDALAGADLADPIVEPAPVVDDGASRPLAAGDGPGAGLGPAGFSSAGDRERFREAAGTWYASRQGAIGTLLAKMPALRSADPDVATADFLAVRAYLDDHDEIIDRCGLNAALRGVGAEQNLAHAACVASGLRRLPAYNGIAFREVELTGAELARYVPGTVLTEWAITEASVRPSADPGVRFQYVIWSTTGRRPVLVAEDQDRDEVLFGPGTSFVVLDVRAGESARTPGAPGAITSILLRDAAQTGVPVSPDLAAARSKKWDDAARQRLSAALTTRSIRGQATSTSLGERLRFPIGLEARIDPSAPATPPNART